MTSSTTIAPRRRGRFRRHEGRSAIQIIEEAFQLLRTASANTMWAYFIGTVPFVASVFYFWADMGRSSYADRDSTIASLGMVAVYFWMKAWHAVFCRRLVATVNPGQMVVFSGWKKVRYFAAQVTLQAFAIPLLLIATVAFFPLPWVYAFFQNVSALGFSKDYENRPLRELFAHALKLSTKDWGQCVGVIVLMKFVALFTWLNLVGAFGAVCFLGKSFFDFETPFTISPLAAFLNTTFLFGSVLITFLVIAPLMKSIFVLRCFYADSRETGADLLSQLAEFRSKDSEGPSSGNPSTKIVGAVSALILSMGIAQGQTAESTGSDPAPTVSADQLTDSIRDTMAQKKYQWRFERMETEGEAAAENSWLGKLLEDFADSIQSINKSIENSLEKFFDQLFGNDNEGRRSTNSNPGGDSGMGMMLQSGFNIFLLVVLAVLIIWLVYILIKRHSSEPPIEVGEVGVGGEIDLESEHIVATQLHEDEWMKLAREKIAAGETRLAIRALFLASLAHLGDRSLLHIKKFKSNYDYSHELRLKAANLPELQDAFKENVGLFERVWYGLHQIGDEAIQHFTSNYERIAAQKSVHETQQRANTGGTL